MHKCQEPLFRKRHTVLFLRSGYSQEVDKSFGLIKQKDIYSEGSVIKAVFLL